MTAAAPDLASLLADQLGIDVWSIRRLAGGASKQSWEIDGPTPLYVRRAGGGNVYAHALTLENEFRLLEAVYALGVRVPRPLAYLPDLAGREAVVMERIEGETIGRRIVRDPPADLADELGRELAKIHAIPIADLPFLTRDDVLGRLEAELDTVGGAYPAIEYGLAWLRAHRPAPLPSVLVHGDFRIGNVAVSRRGVEAVLDWELASVGDPREDLAWPLVRAWRFGRDALRFGGVSEPEAFVASYADAGGRMIGLAELHWWEVLGNARWTIGSLTQAQRHLNGEERNVELAVLGRLAAEVEYELLDLIERGGPA